jgi:preprotein translocase subunit SecD
MTLNRFAGVLVVALLLAPSLIAAEDLSGQWSGTFIITMDEQPPRDDVAHMVAKHTGAELTGTIGPNTNEQYPIANGKVVTAKEDGKDVTRATFEVSEGGGSGPVLRFELTLAGGRLKGSAKGEHEGHKMAAAIDLARVK